MNTKMGSKNAEYEKKLKLHETSETDNQINCGILSRQLLFITKRRPGEMWGKTLTGKVS